LTVAVTVPPVIDDHPRPSLLGGLWAFLGGGTVMASQLVWPRSSNTKSSYCAPACHLAGAE